MPHNKKRADKLKRLSVPELQKIIESGSLSSAGAAYELRRRNNDLTSKERENHE